MAAAATGTPPLLTLCPENMVTRVSQPTPADATVRPDGVARLTSRSVFYVRSVVEEARSTASAFIDTYIPGHGTLAGKYLPRYIGCCGTILGATGETTIMSFEAADRQFLQDDHRAMHAIITGAGRDRLDSANQYKGPKVPDWIRIKTECLDSIEEPTLTDDVYLKPSRSGIKIITLREEFDEDDSTSKTVLVRSPAANRAKLITTSKLIGLTVDVIFTIKYRLVLDLHAKTCAVRQDLHLHSVYEKEDAAANVDDDDPAIAGFEKAADYEDQLAEALATPERGTQRARS